MKKADIGLIGLGVMGQNLALNLESKGFSVAVYNRTGARTEYFLSGKAKGKDITGYESVGEMVENLVPPKKVMLMVKAGEPVDYLISQLLPVLEPEDIIIDGGNSMFADTERRFKDVESRGLYYIGAGISGGEEGALIGPSIMPGGSYEAWEEVKDILQSIAAKIDSDGSPCCCFIGTGGAGHFVKMVHNGIEYSDMQLIAEAYFLLKTVLYKNPSEMADIFEGWNRGPLNSYLMEITVDILRKKDPETGGYLVEMILDKARDKGTGIWACKSALDLAVPVPNMAQAVFSRYLSAMKDERKYAQKHLEGPDPKAFSEREDFVAAIHDALYGSKVVSYAQGFHLLKKASAEFSWGLDLGSIAKIWRGGCIIRADLLDVIAKAYRENPNLVNIVTGQDFVEALKRIQSTWRLVAVEAISRGIPVPGILDALSYYDGYRAGSLPANLIQAQRDYFGAHTYERVDRAGICHTKWVQ